MIIADENINSSLILEQKQSKTNIITSENTN